MLKIVDAHTRVSVTSPRPRFPPLLRVNFYSTCKLPQTRILGNRITADIRPDLGSRVASQTTGITQRIGPVQHPADWQIPTHKEVNTPRLQVNKKREGLQVT